MAQLRVGIPAPNIMQTRRALLAMAAPALAACAPGIATQRDGGVEYVAAAGAGPTVVFENGLGGQLDWWQAVLPMLPPATPYFVYNRPGYGRSAPTTTPRDGATIVAELRMRLRAIGIAPPHILVGHSFGGLTMQLFARAHPHEAAALILVDSTHPRQFEGDGAMERQSPWVRTVVGLLATGVVAEELARMPETGAQVLALPPPARVPVTILAAARPMREQGSALARHSNAMRADLVRLYLGAREIWVDSDHGIPRERPDAVAEAIVAARPRIS